MSLIKSNLVEFEEYKIDRAQWSLSWRNEPLPLNRKTFDLLFYLVEHADRVVGKDELLRTIWPQSFVEESNLTQHIFLLRKALSRHDSGRKIIETVPGRGYRFAAVIQQQQQEQQLATDRTVVSASESITRITLEEEVDTPETALQEVALIRPLTSKPLPKRRTAWITGGSVLVVTLCVGGWFGWQRWLDRSGGPPVQVILTPMEGTTGDAILDKTLTQVLRMDLAQSPFVSVVQESTVQATLTQMMHRPGDVTTPEMLREVCERTNSQSVLSGNIAKLGQHFLITEQASNCIDGSTVAAARYEADKLEDLPRGVDRLAASLRQKLGESRRSIARFNMPLLPVSTTSLEALKDYTRAILLINQGKVPDASMLLKNALQLDPEFAAARFALATNYLSDDDLVNARPAIVEAYEVRDNASEPIRQAIIALYDKFSTQDLFASERNYRSWTELYPRSVQAWNGLSNVQRDLGHHADAAASALKALALRSTSQALYVNAAHEQLTAGDLQGSRATLDSAISHKMDGDPVRANYLKLAFLLQDSSLQQTQSTWIEAHPGAAYCRIEQVAIALEEGRFTDVQRLLPQATALFRQQGSSFADIVTKNVGANLVESGEREAGTRILHSVPLDPEDGDDLVGLVDSGDLKTADASTQAMLSKYPQGTMWQEYYGPRVKAAIALANHHPKQAIAIMEATRPLDDRDPDTRKFRGDAYLAAGQASLAAKEYRAILAHHEVEPESPAYPLSWLGLARALTAEGDRSGALEAYLHFFTLWAHADPGAMYLGQAKQEFAALQTSSSAK